MFGKLLGLSRSADLYFPGWNTRPNLMCRNFSAMGNYSTCCNNSPFSNVSLVKHSGIHSDESTFSNGSSMNDGTMSHRYIILQDARHRTGLMDAGAILYIHSVSTSDGIHVRAQYRTIPDAAVITKNAVAGQHCVLSDKTILSPTGSLSFYCLYNSHIKYVYDLQFGCKGNKKYWNHMLVLHKNRHVSASHGRIPIL